MLPSASDPVLIEGPVSKRGKSVAGIGLWWKTRYLRLTSSFLTITDLKQQTLLASISTADFLFCAPVKTRRATGRRFLLRLADGSVLQFAALTLAECVQWVTVINGVITVCEKQRAKDTLAWQRRKEAALQAGAGAFAVSSPNLSDAFHPAQPTAATPLPITPHALTPGAIPPAPLQTRAQTSGGSPSPASTGTVLHSATLAPVDGARLTRASSTGVVIQRREMDRRKARDRSVEESRAEATLQAQERQHSALSRKDHDVREDAVRRGRVVNWGEKSERDAPTRGIARGEERFRRGTDDGDGFGHEDDRFDRRGEERWSSRDGSDDDYVERRRYARYYDHHTNPYAPAPPPVPGYYAWPYALPPPSFRPPTGLRDTAALGPPPRQRLLFFFLLFLLFSFTILASGHTFGTSQQVAAMYHRHVLQRNATLYAYAEPLTQAVQSWPLLGFSLSGLYLAFLFQVVMREKGGDEVDWVGGGLAGVVCSYCMWAVSLRAKAYLQAFGFQV